MLFSSCTLSPLGRLIYFRVSKVRALLRIQSNLPMRLPPVIYHFSKITKFARSSCYNIRTSHRQLPLISNHDHFLGWRVEIFYCMRSGKWPLDTWSHLTGLNLNSMTPYNPNIAHLLMYLCTCDTHYPLKILHFIFSSCLLAYTSINENKPSQQNLVWPCMWSPPISSHLGLVYWVVASGRSSSI